MCRVKAPLIAAFEGSMGGDEHAIFEDADLVGEYVNIQDTATCRVGDAISTQSAGTAATGASGRIMETRNSVSPGRRVRAVIAKATATIPATRPCMISPSHSRMTGNAQIKVTRMRLTLDTSKPDLDDSDQTLHCGAAPCSSPRVVPRI